MIAPALDKAPSFHGFDVGLTAIENEADAKDYFALLKPRVMALVVFTALAGILLGMSDLAVAYGHGHTVVGETHAWHELGSFHPLMGFVALFAIAVGAGASGALNMWYDADIDALMSRTANRPIPAGKIVRSNALTFGLILSAFAIGLLAFATNLLAAGLLAFTIFFYVVVYTMVLKRLTPQNIVIGGMAGALPPVIGYAAVTGFVSVSSLILFLLIFLWTPPHFWALALVKHEDYARARVPMMPNAKGMARTQWEILFYTLALLPVGFLPLLMGFAHLPYAVCALVVSVWLLTSVARVFLVPSHELAAPKGRRACWNLFAVSIFYLFVLYVGITAEQILILWGIV